MGRIHRKRRAPDGDCAGEDECGCRRPPRSDHHAYLTVYLTVTLPSAGTSTSKAMVPESSFVKG